MVERNSEVRTESDSNEDTLGLWTLQNGLISNTKSSKELVCVRERTGHSRELVLKMRPWDTGGHTFSRRSAESMLFLQ